MKNNTDDFDLWIAKIIAKRPDFASEYLSATLAENKNYRNNSAILSALKQIALAQGMNNVSKRAGIGRVTLSRALSKKGNPRMDTFMSIINAMGLNLNFSPQVKSSIHA